MNVYEESLAALQELLGSTHYSQLFIQDGDTIYHNGTGYPTEDIIDMIGATDTLVRADNPHIELIKKFYGQSEGINPEEISQAYDNGILTFENAAQELPNYLH